METLIELLVAIISGGLGVVLFRLLKPKSVSTKETQAVLIKVEDKSKENAKIAEDAAKALEAAQAKIDALEAEKKKDPTKQALDDFFNNRK